MLSKFFSKLKSILSKTSATTETIPTIPTKKTSTPKKSKTTKTTKTSKKSKTTKTSKTSKSSKPKKDDVNKIVANLSTLPGIGSKSAKAFYEAGFKTPKQILSAKDEELLAIPGVGINLVKKLRK